MEKYTIDNLNDDADYIRKKHAVELRASETRVKLIKRKIKDEMEACREKFYDSSLIDANGEPLRIGDKFEYEGSIYLVEDRYNQAIFDFMNNPRLVCIKQLKEGKWTKTKYNFYKSDTPEVKKMENKTISQVVDEHLEKCEKNKDKK